MLSVQVLTTYVINFAERGNLAVPPVVLVSQGAIHDSRTFLRRAVHIYFIDRRRSDTGIGSRGGAEYPHVPAGYRLRGISHDRSLVLDL
jgi:hypothetical protein